jgi:hypothetical protein
VAGAAGGGQAIGAIGGAPAARRAAAALHAHGMHGAARGRLVWLPDGRGDAPADEVAAWAAAVCAQIGRAGAAVGAPGAVSLPFARSAALDRVLAWHDAIVVVPEPGSSDAVLERALTSLGALGRPVAAMAPASRLGGLLALAGVRAPAEAVGAVAQLGFGRDGRPGA